MNKHTCLIITALLLLSVALIGCIRGVEGDSPAPLSDQAEPAPAQDGDSHVNVGSGVEEALEAGDSVKVLISLRDVDELMAVPIAEWDRELLLGIDMDERARHAQEVQDNVRSALGPEDATGIVELEGMPALGATITASGLEILRHHPDVVGIGLALGVPFDDMIVE